MLKKLYAVKSLPVIIGGQRVLRQGFVDTGEVIETGLTPIEDGLVEHISGVAVGDANGERQVRQVFAIFGSMVDLLARSMIRDDGTRNTWLIPTYQTEEDPNPLAVGDVRIKRRPDPENPDGAGRQIRWDKYAPADPSLQPMLRTALIGLCIAAIEHVEGAVAPAATSIDVETVDAVIESAA